MPDIRKKTPLVTVLMSVYNNSDFVDKAIRSILAQLYNDFEFLIIDDASTDNTPEIINSHNDSRIRIVRNKENLGLTRSLNRGLKEAIGKYIARIDADDTSHPERLMKQVGFLEENPGFVLIGTSFNIVSKNSQLIREVVYNTKPEKLYYDLIFQNMIAHSSAFFRLKNALSVGGYNEDCMYAQDYDLWLKLSRTGKIWVLPEVLTNWCDDPENISSKRKNEQDQAARTIFETNLKKVGAEKDFIADSVYLHNYYDINFISIPEEKVYRVFSLLSHINNKIVLSCPDFYDKKVMSEVAYQSIADLMTRIFKETRNRSGVVVFLIRNLFDLKLVKKIFAKVMGNRRKRTNKEK